MEGGEGDFEARLRALLARRDEGFLELRAAERLSGGASQETYRIAFSAPGGERTLALRRSPGGAEGRLPEGPDLATEAALLRAAREAGVPVPEVVHVLAPGDGLGDGFLMDWVEGEVLGARIARGSELEAVRPRLARQCGEILARIHGIDLERGGLRRRLLAATPEACVRASWERYQAFETPQPMIDYTARWLLEHLPGDAPLRLVHGDFRNGNLIVTQEGVAAVLDWELAHVGDPARDLGWLCTSSWRFGRPELPVGGFGRYADLFAGYATVSGTPVDPVRVRFWEVFGSFWWSVGCLQMAERQRAGPDPSIERAAIGRRSSECQVDCVNLLIPGPVARIEAQARACALERPGADELLEGVGAYLRGEVAGETRGRTRFLARVAANAVDIVRRELALAPALRARERELLGELLGGTGSLEALRWRLVHALRGGALPLDHPGLAEYLREAVVNQVAIDQPGYAGLREALGESPRVGD
jgi:aminoglycoside phosphotransferase (APT) family kinase protein